MIARLINWSLDHRASVLCLLAVICVAGAVAALHLPIEAFPDLTNNQVVIITECPAMPPEEVEKLVTFPIETAVMGLPGTESIRSISKLGLSVVTLIFDDDVSTYFARQLVNERLQEVRSRLPEGPEPQLGPVATVFGEAFQYTVESEEMGLSDRKTLQDWSIRHQLRTVPGVNEVNTWGGESKQYVVEVDPRALQRYGLTLRDVFRRVQENNRNFGGGFIEHGEQQYTVRGLGRLNAPEDLGRIVLTARAGTPVLIRDVAAITVGAMPRQGATLRDGQGETVSGMAILLKGENARDAIARVKAKLAATPLPQSTKIIPFYDQSEVIDRTIATVRRNLLEAGVLVAAILLLFLGNLRAALIVALVIPASMLFGFAGMAIYGLSANLMSLGAIDFGMVVDGAVVMMENSVRHLAEDRRRGTLETIRAAAHEVSRPIVYAVGIIVVAYLPVLALEGLEGRMFRPMAITVVSLLTGALLLALTVVPVFATYALRGAVKEGQGHDGWFARFRGAYGRSLDWSFHRRPAVLAMALAAVIAALGSLAWIGTEFMPRLDEGSLLITTRKLPGISLTESVAISNRIEKLLRTAPEVRGVVTKLGRPDVATEAMGVYEADVYVLLHPREQWTRFESKEELVADLASKLQRVPGVSYNFTQPMAMRLDEVVSGIKADVAVKIFGEDTSELERLGAKVLAILNAVPGAADGQMEILSGVPELRARVNRAALSRYGLNVSDVSELLDSTTGGVTVSDVIEGQRRFPVAIRLPREYRADLNELGNLPLEGPGGERVRLNQVTDIETADGPEVISREAGRRRIVVQVNVRGNDIGSFVSVAQARIDRELSLPAGYVMEWGGQFENQRRAMKRLSIALPLSVVLIFGLLFATFRSAAQGALILMNVPFAMVGGVAALWIRGLNLNVSASVGFLALFGVAVLNGIVMVACINMLRAGGMAMENAVREGAAMRLRPVLMTALVASLGFLPMALSQAPGAEVQRPLATVVIGGLMTSTILTLYVLPLVYGWFSRRPTLESEIAIADTAGGR